MWADQSADDLVPERSNVLVEESCGAAPKVECGPCERGRFQTGDTGILEDAQAHSGGPITERFAAANTLNTGGRLGDVVVRS